MKLHCTFQAEPTTVAYWTHVWDTSPLHQSNLSTSPTYSSGNYYMLNRWNHHLLMLWTYLKKSSHYQYRTYGIQNINSVLSGKSITGGYAGIDSRASRNLTNPPDGAAHQTNWPLGGPNHPHKTLKFFDFPEFFFGHFWPLGGQLVWWARSSKVKVKFWVTLIDRQPCINSEGG